jgi:Na+/melibiose symporter-like transporter
MLSDSAIIILFANALGAGSTISLVTAALPALSRSLLLIPAAFWSVRIGYKKTIMLACMAGSLAMLAVPFVPALESYASTLLIFLLALYVSVMSFFEAAWLPLVDGFLRQDRRSGFFGKMRFSWQATSLVYFFICSLFMGENPPMWKLQTIIIMTVPGLWWRMWFVARLPQISKEEREKTSLKNDLLKVIANKPLVGFSVYMCCLYTAAYGTAPLAFLYMKKHLLVPENMVVLVSSLYLGGMLAGYLAAGWLTKKFGIKNSLLGSHAIFGLVNIGLFFIGSNDRLNIAMMTILLITFGFVFSISSVAMACEMMSLASPRRRAMSLAFTGSLFAAGCGCSRLGSSLIIGSGILAPAWKIGSITFSNYQSMFLMFGISVLFVSILLVLVPAIFPKEEYEYIPRA